MLSTHNGNNNYKLPRHNIHKTQTYTSNKIGSDEFTHLGTGIAKVLDIFVTRT